MDVEIVDQGIIFDFIVEIFEEEEQRRIQFHELKLERQLLRDTGNPFALDAQYFRRYYRFTPEVALLLVNLIQDRIIVLQNSTIPPHVQVLIALRFLAEGSFQKGFGQDFLHPVSQATASRCVETVVNAINTLTNQFINFPHTAAERQRVQNGFRQSIRIPGILGLVDGFLVCFKKPPHNEEAFYNYRVKTSMNVQIIVDSEYIIQNLRICPGSNNDRYIWQFSAAKQYMEDLRNNQDIVDQEGHYYILGDSGYSPSPVLLTPILRAPVGTPEAVYTEEHVRTRCQVERTIGILSGVWMAISRARKLHYSAEKVANIINACGVLHNFRRKHGIVDDIPEIDDYVPVEDNVDIFEERMNYAQGIQERNRLINLYYN